MDELKAKQAEKAGKTGDIAPKPTTSKPVTAAPGSPIGKPKQAPTTAGAAGSKVEGGATKLEEQIKQAEAKHAAALQAERAVESIPGAGSARITEAKSLSEKLRLELQDLTNRLPKPKNPIKSPTEAQNVLDAAYAEKSQISTFYKSLGAPRALTQNEISALNQDVAALTKQGITQVGFTPLPFDYVQSSLGSLRAGTVLTPEQIQGIQKIQESKMNMADTKISQANDFLEQATKAPTTAGNTQSRGRVNRMMDEGGITVHKKKSSKQPSKTSGAKAPTEPAKGPKPATLSNAVGNAQKVLDDALAQEKSLKFGYGDAPQWAMDKVNFAETLKNKIAEMQANVQKGGVPTKAQLRAVAEASPAVHAAKEKIYDTQLGKVKPQAGQTYDDAVAAAQEAFKQARIAEGKKLGLTPQESQMQIYELEAAPTQSK